MFLFNQRVEKLQFGHDGHASPIVASACLSNGQRVQGHNFIIAAGNHTNVFSG